MVAVMCTSITAGAGCSREVRSTVTGKVDYDGQTLNSGYIHVSSELSGDEGH